MQTGMDTVWFPSKVDWWLGVLLVFPPASALAALADGLLNGDSEALLVGVVTAAFVIALYWLLVIPVRYGISSTELVIRFGVIRQRVDLVSIDVVEPTKNPLSSPALSLDRLAIRVGEGVLSTTMISPDDREGFLNLLANNAGLHREGERLVRR